jgi:hypothetical protein
MILEFRPSIRRAENSQVRKHLLESPGNIVSAMHSRRRCELGLFMHAKHPREVKLHPDLLPLIGADWFLRSLGIAIANNVMHDKFSSTCQRSARRHHESRGAPGRLAGSCFEPGCQLVAHSDAVLSPHRNRRVESRLRSKPEQYIRKADGARHLRRSPRHGLTRLPQGGTQKETTSLCLAPGFLTPSIHLYIGGN